MNLLEMITNAQNGGAMQQLGNNFGLGESDARNAVGALLPALSRGLQKNTANQDGLSGLLGALNNGNHQRYLDNPAELQRPEAVQDGNAILGHIFGNKDVSRNVAAHAAQQTGLDSGILKKMLPMVAAMAMGSLGKQASSSGFLGSSLNQQGASSGLGGMLGSFLDADKDGSVADDLLNMAKKFF